MTLFNVHLYREMHLLFTAIEAETPEAAASIARTRPTDEADHIDDCDGANLGALVDEVGDKDYERSVMIDFECERERKAAAEMLATLRAFVAADQLAAECGEWKWENLEPAFAQARAAIATAEAAALPETAVRLILTVTVRGGLVQDLDATASVTVIVEDWDTDDDETGEKPARSIHTLAGKTSGQSANVLLHRISNE